MDSILNIPKPTWVPIGCPKSVSLYSHTSIPFKRYIITFGGTDDSIIMNQTFALDVDTYKWQNINITGNKPTTRYGHSACLWGNDGAIIFGGKGASLLNEVLVLNLTSPPLSGEYKILQTKNAGSLHRMWHTANILEGNMYVFGGKSKQQETTNQLWRLDLTTLTWQKCDPSGYVPGSLQLDLNQNNYRKIEERYSHSSVVCNGKIYYFGGYSSRFDINLVDLFCLDTNKMTFTQLAYGNICPEPRRGMSLFQRHNKKLYIFGGKQDNDNYFNDIYSYDLNGSLGWIKIEAKNKPPQTRGWQTCTPYKSGFVIWGGAHWDIIFNDIFFLHFDSEELEHESEIPQVAVNNFLSQIKNMYTQKLFCDISFEVEGQTFQAHRGILTARSKYFTNMFNSGMKESFTDTIPIPDVKKNTFEAFLNFIYTNEIDQEEIEMMMELFELGEKWSVLDLRNHCEHFLSQSISQTNLIKIATLAELYDNEILKDQVIKFMVKNFKDLEDKNLLEDLPKSLFIKFTTSIIKHTS